MTVDDIAVKGELQFGRDIPCGGDGQAGGLVPIHHAVVNDKWRLGAESPEESERSHGRSTWCTIRARVHGDEGDVDQVKELGDGEFE
jgi:hypothetical protein